MFIEDKFVTLTWTFVRDKRTTMQEKLVLMEILNLSMLEHGCVAHNEHFSELMDIKKSSVSRLISSLESKGFITSEIQKGTRNFSRKIIVNKMLFDPSQNVIQPITKCYESKENNTSNNKDALEIPSWMDKTAWNEWVTYRKETKKPLTDSTMKKQWKLLEKQIDYHVEIINNSITNGWAGLFPLKDNQIAESPNTKKVKNRYYKGLGIFLGHNSKGLERYAN